VASVTRPKTRAESQADTRARLMAAAWAVFAERGFGSTSVEAVASRAGFTRGAFYSNFADKEAIFLALVLEHLNGRAAAVGRVLRRSGPLTVFADLRAWNEDEPDDPRWLPLMAEFRAHALRNETARAGLAAHERALRDLYGQAIRAQFDVVGITPTSPIEHMALVVQALDHWFGVQRAIEPEGVPEGALFEILATLFRAEIALAEREGQ
jgi:AcrR family transcriptional regulator